MVDYKETEAWNDRFEWLGYDNVVFVLTMGSLLMIFFIVCLQVLIGICLLKGFSCGGLFKGKYGKKITACWLPKFEKITLYNTV